MLQLEHRENEKRVVLVLIGYARVSTGLQNLDLQTDALTQHECSKIFHDKMSGTKKQRPGLEEALEYAREGDTIVVWRLDRLGRNMQDLIQIVNTLNERGVAFHSLQENLTMDKSNATGQLIFHLSQLSLNLREFNQRNDLQLVELLQEHVVVLVVALKSLEKKILK